MIAVPVRLPGIDDDTNGLITYLLNDLAARQTRNLLRQSYYDSKRKVLDLARVVPPIYQDYAFALGWSAKAVDALARRCTLLGFTWPDGDLDSLGIDEWLTDNRVLADSSRSIKDSLMYGPAFLISSAGAEDEPRSLVTSRDALSATGIWNRRRRALDAALSIDATDRDDPMPTALSVYLPGRTIAARRDPGKSSWSVGVADHPGLGNLAEPLTYRPDARRPLGRSRITRPIMALQDAALRGLMRLEGHMDVYSFPEYWMLGADETIFKAADGSQKAAWQVRMGRIKGIPDDEDATNPRADVKQFTGSDPASHLANLNALAKMFAREASLPDSAVAITDVSNPTSAESYDASQYELIAEAEGAMDDWRPAFRTVALKGLAIQNGLSSVPAEWSSIEPRWRDPRFESRAAMADAGMKQLTAIPWLTDTDVGLELLGLDPQQISRAQAARRRSAGSALLGRIRADAG